MKIVGIVNHFGGVYCYEKVPDNPLVIFEEEHEESEEKDISIILKEMIDIAYEPIRKKKKRNREKYKWTKVRKQILEQHNFMCSDCGDVAVCVHHIEPVSKRTDLVYCEDNLVPLCVKCHRSKHPELPDFMFLSKNQIKKII